jgi:hypothetical protein
VASRRRSSQRTVTGTLTDLQRRVKFLQNQQSPTRLGNQSVVRSAIQPRAVDTDQLALNAVTNDQIAADAVDSEQIAVGAVGTRELSNLSVTNAKLGAFAVTADKIGNEQVDTRTLGPLAVTNAKLDNLAVNNAKLSNAAVEERNMTPNSVANNSLQTNSVSFRTIDVDAVGNENMLGNAIGNAEMRDNAIGTPEVQNGAITQSKIGTDAVGFGELQGSAVRNSTIQNGAVTDAKIGGTIGGGKIGSGFNGSNINDRSITGSKLADGTVTNRQINRDSYSAIVAFGLSAGFGIRKRGAEISVDSGAFASNSHIHFYSSPTRDAEDRPLRTFQFFNTTGPDGSPSSEKFKKNISNHKITNPKKLLELELKKYKYKRSYKPIEEKANREWMHGYILEDLIGLGFDEVIYYDSEGNPNRVDYGLFSALVLELVKVQQQEIESLQEKVKNLEDKK